MSRYIDAEWLLNRYREVQFRDGMTEGVVRFLVEVNITNAPSIDIVRCRECKYAHMTYGGECKYCDKWSLEDSLYLDGDFFCSYGERKESEP